MIKTLLTSFLLALTISVSFLGTSRVVNSVTFDQPRSYVYIVNRPEFGEQAHGSGVMIADGLMLTAAHVVAGENPDIVVNGKKATVIKMDRDLDIALLKVELSCPCASLASQSPTIDAAVLAVGFPLSLGELATEGRYQGISEGKTISTTSVVFGNSGGGLFQFNWLKNQWELVGIVVQMPGASLGMFGIPVFNIAGSVTIETIKEFLK